MISQKKNPVCTMMEREKKIVPFTGFKLTFKDKLQLF